MSNHTDTKDPAWYLRLINLAQDSTAQPLWSPDELAEVWTCQLNASVAKCVEELSLVHAIHCQTLCAEATPPIANIRDLIASPSPDLQLLSMVARWIEQMLADTDELVPRDISLALFSLFVVLARVRSNTHLIGGSDAHLAKRAIWVAARPWIDPSTRQLMRDAATTLGGADSEARHERQN